MPNKSAARYFPTKFLDDFLAWPAQELDEARGEKCIEMEVCKRRTMRPPHNQPSNDRLRMIASIDDNGDFIVGGLRHFRLSAFPACRAQGLE
jgi:hypothetical protein